MTTHRPTQALRDEHAELLPHIEALAVTARRLPELAPEERGAVIADSLAFLEGQLLPHARAEEEVLYPAWAALVGYPDAAGTMVREHEAIVARITALGGVAVDDPAPAQELLFGLHALITMHFSTEECLALDAFDANPDAAASMLQALHH